MRLLFFYALILISLVLLAIFAEKMGPALFVTGLILYCFYNLCMGYLKLRRKGYNAGLFSYLNPFSTKSSDLYRKVYFEP